MIRRDEDNHVHSTFSDGKGTLAENISAAEAKGLRHLTCVDHVRADTDWLPDYFQAVADARKDTHLQLEAGIEAKLMDTDGILDLPAEADEADRIMIADHQLPSPDGPLHPDLIRSGLKDGSLDAQTVTSWLILATQNAVIRYPRTTVVHFASILPKIGLGHQDLDREQLYELAEVLVEHDAAIEISERWRCPGVSVLRIFRDAGATIVLGSDAHSPDKIGCFPHALAVADELEGR